MLGGGHITGRFLDKDTVQKVSSALDSLITPEAMAKRYGDNELAPLLFAVGDGNHSLATAKTIYEEIKTAIGEEAASAHPARFALVEIVNIHDEALKFEPIYRVLFGVDSKAVIEDLEKYIESLSGNADPQTVECITLEGTKTLNIMHPEKQLTVGTLQDFIDGYIKKNPGVEVDYIHGVEALIKLSNKENTIGFLFEGMKKEELFAAVKQDGSLPRKTFSMGHAADKRYYLEARTIK
jgi:hypothetical protein